MTTINEKLADILPTDVMVNQVLKAIRDSVQPLEFVRKDFDNWRAKKQNYYISRNIKDNTFHVRRTGKIIRRRVLTLPEAIEYANREFEKEIMRGLGL